MRLGGLAVLGVANNCLESAPPLGKRPPGSVPLTVLRVSGNRSSSFKVYHESGMLLEGENIPVCAALCAGLAPPPPRARVASAQPLCQMQPPAPSS